MKQCIKCGAEKKTDKGSCCLSCTSKMANHKGQHSKLKIYYVREANQ
jgi:hypothetical protein